MKTAFAVLVALFVPGGFLIALAVYLRKRWTARDAKSTSVSSARRWFCALRGHEHIVRFEPARIYLVCVGCGAETPGWMLDAPRPIVKYARLLRFKKRFVA